MACVKKRKFVYQLGDGIFFNYVLTDFDGDPVSVDLIIKEIDDSVSQRDEAFLLKTLQYNVTSLLQVVKCL